MIRAVRVTMNNYYEYEYDCSEEDDDNDDV